MNETFDLRRFVDVQQNVYDQVLAELGAGRKESHWMWFIFPQVAGLGHSPMAWKFAIASVAEAKHYLAHPLLGERLRECVRLVLNIKSSSASDIFGSPDDIKFHSCTTLFAQVDDADSVFSQALRQFFAGEFDQKTLAIIARAENFNL